MGPHFRRHVADLTIKQCKEDYKQANFYPPPTKKGLILKLQRVIMLYDYRLTGSPTRVHFYTI